MNRVLASSGVFSCSSIANLLLAVAALPVLACGRVTHQLNEVDDGGAGGTPDTIQSGAPGDPVSVGGSGGAPSGQGLGGLSDTGGVLNTGGTMTGGTMTDGGGGPFACEHVAATCDIIGDFPVQQNEVWGSGRFTGGFVVFGNGMQRDPSTSSALHVTGTVAGYGQGFGVWFNSCSSLQAFTGIAFTIGGAASGNGIDLLLETNADYPWQAAPPDRRGACTASDPPFVWQDCIFPSFPRIGVPNVPTRISVTWNQLDGGSPVPWSATASPGELLGILWQFPWNATMERYLVDVTLDDVTFTGAGENQPCPALQP